MAKHTKGRRRRFGRYIKGGVDEELALSTLAAKTLITASFDDSVSDRALITSIEWTLAIREWTAAAGVGPVLVGIAHSNYTGAEIEAWIEQTASWEEADLVEQEVAKRLIRKLGIFVNEGGSPNVGVSLNNGVPKKTKLNWKVNDAQTLQLWCYNLGTAAFATTSPTVDLQGHCNIFML